MFARPMLRQAILLCSASQCAWSVCAPFMGSERCERGDYESKGALTKPGHFAVPGRRDIYGPAAAC
jgi:hypothetical protein